MTITFCTCVKHVIDFVSLNKNKSAKTCMAVIYLLEFVYWRGLYEILRTYEKENITFTV